MIRLMASGIPYMIFVYPCIYIYLKLMKYITVRPVKDGVDPRNDKVEKLITYYL